MTYGTNAAFTTYHTARGRDVSAYSTTEIDAALLVASTSLDNRYRSAFAGCKVDGRDQANEWPRNGAYDINGDSIAATETPDEVESATYELALQELILPGALALNYSPPKFESVSVDGAVAVKYNLLADASELQTSFQIVDEILSTLMVHSISGLSGAAYL